MSTSTTQTLARDHPGVPVPSGPSQGYQLSRPNSLRKLPVKPTQMLALFSGRPEPDVLKELKELICVACYPKPSETESGQEGCLSLGLSSLQRIEYLLFLWDMV